MNIANIIALVILALCLLVNQQMVLACTCAPPVKISDRFERASEVFIGEVTAIKLDSKAKQLPVVSFNVSKRWKGTASTIVSFPSALYGEMCGYPFKVGEKYLVYVVPGAMGAYGNAAQIGICTGTDLANGRENEMTQLDHLRAAQSE